MNWRPKRQRRVSFLGRWANEKRKRPYREPKARWPSRAAAAASERRRRGGAGRQGCGPGGRGGLGAARSAGPSPPLALRRAALGGADWALWRRGGEAEAGAVGAKEEEKGEGLGPGRGGPPLACALAFPEEAGSSSAAAAAAVNGVMWIRGGTEQLLSQRIYRIRSQLIGSAGLHSLTLQRPPALRAAGGIQKGNCAAPRVPRLVLPPGRRHAGCPRGRAGHGGVSLSSFKETLTLRFPQGPWGRALVRLALGNFLPATRKREWTFQTNPGHAALALKTSCRFWDFIRNPLQANLSPFLFPLEGATGREEGGGEGEREVRWEGYWFILCLLD